MKHAVLPDGQSPTVAFTVLAQLCGPKANETEMGDALFTKSDEGRNFDFDARRVEFSLMFKTVLISITSFNVSVSSV